MTRNPVGKRQALIQAGLSVAEHHGLAQLSVNQIVAEAGVSEGTLLPPVRRPGGLPPPLPRSAGGGDRGGRRGPGAGPDAGCGRGTPPTSRAAWTSGPRGPC
ncbi:TetR family transcriptional regulator [Actinomadura sp. LD22]|uniref:TetR family transcriptional regulator n=1 Tax=Actinomadura physcomitrii TaxID=2650748 RepID=A0A6I4MNP3_9ACTN|nr:TetR family transcriptional regulator [Actinomadura physcomitrii]